MEKRKFGNTGFEVSIMGFGGGQIGDFAVPEHEVEKVLHTALDLGINFIDTARGYYASEDRIGRFLKDRKDEFILSTKVGYGIEGVEDWTYEAVTKGIDESLKWLQRDVLDIVHLHSCSKETIMNNGLDDALYEAKEKGKLKIAAYSGENEDLAWAVDSGRFASLQSSVNIFDQWGLKNVYPKAKERSMGTIAKRSIGNAPWRFSDHPKGEYCEEYWKRMKAMELDFGERWLETALRFTAYAPGVDTMIVGTTNSEHLRDNVEQVNKGPLENDLVEKLKNVFAGYGSNWAGMT